MKAATIFAHRWPWQRCLHAADNLSSCCRPRGKSSIIVPSGGVDCSAWLAFRSALARIEAQTLERPPVQVLGSLLIEVSTSAGGVCHNRLRAAKAFLALVCFACS